MTSADVKLNKENTKYVISDEWETLKPKGDNVKKRETPCLALRKIFLMGKIWRPSLEAGARASVGFLSRGDRFRFAF